MIKEALELIGKVIMRSSVQFNLTIYSFICILALLVGLVGCGRPVEPAVGAEAVATDEAKESRVADGASDRRDESEAAASEPAAEDNQAAQPAAPDADTAEDVAGEQPKQPFTRRFDVPEFPRDAEWINTQPLKMDDLEGKFVLLDFWTYCCINCIHILPELKELEEKYPNELVVIGVHSAKFETEKETQNIAEAVLRYEIEHPVVNDPDHKIWNSLGVSSWPTIVLIDPQGKAVWGRPGEFKAEDVVAVLERAMPYYRSKDLLDETPIRFELLAYEQTQTPLRFPGKVLADEAGNRLFISDSNHNRIVVTSLDGKLLYTIGSSEAGRADGDFATAQFDHPQGMALQGETLYVADTENHLLRKVDLAEQTVTTIAGTGEQARHSWPGLDKLRDFSSLPEKWVGPPNETAINSPWDLLVHGEGLYIAMAGPHQIWRMSLDEQEIGPYAGDGVEDIVDGKLLPEEPPVFRRFQKEEGVSSFAQPSGLAADGKWLYVADSEGSSIRAVPLDPNTDETVKTVVGTAHLPYGRLFTFGDVDGSAQKARLQHPLGVAYHEGTLYVVDTYNNKLKAVDAQTGQTRTFVGTREPGLANDPPQFDEPTGVTLANGKLYVADTNNHVIRVVDLESKQVSTLDLQGVEPPPEQESMPNFADAKTIEAAPVKLQPTEGMARLRVQLALPEGWKLNELAPMAYWVEAKGQSIEIDGSVKSEFEEPQSEFVVDLPVKAEGQSDVTVSMFYFYCQTDGGLCRVGSVVWKVPVTVTESAAKSEGQLFHEITP